MESAVYNRRGLIKLMLRLPALRGQLQILTASDAELLNLCGAYEEASATLEKLRARPTEFLQPQIDEYQTLCEEIENEILSICYQRSRAQKS